MTRGPARLLFCLAWPCALAAQPVTYRLDPLHSTVQFEVSHFNTSTLRGRFAMLNGLVTLDAAAQRGEVGLSVDTATVDTGLKVLDARLRQPDLLGSSGHPQAWFVASRFAYRDGRVDEVRGEFTLRGISQPLALKALRFACRQDERLKTEVCGGDFEATLLRSEFGATFGLPFVGDKVRLLIQVEALRDPDLRQK
ncbi:MAG: polyisoprenoid-binding protein [Burkholderiaceae bacterium]|nr:polyisoprenoid-binding protein [Burkholderiaceae bacterium]